MKWLYKIFSVTVLLLVAFGRASAQDDVLVDYAINLERDTWLSDVAPDRVDRIGKLTLSGYVKGADLKYLRSAFTQMTELDLSNATIVETDGDNNIYNRYIASEPRRMNPTADYIVYDYYVKNNTVGYLMFCGYWNLEKLILPDNVTEIEDGSIMSGINVAFHNNPDFVVENGLLLNKDRTRLIVAASRNESYVVPSTVKEIAPYSFAKRKYREVFDGRDVIVDSYVKQVEIPSSVEKIGLEAFKNCDKLTTVTFNIGGLKSQELNIDKSAFYGCPITGLQLPDNTNVVGDSAFCDNQIRSLTLKGAKNIVRKAFCNNPIQSVVLSDNLEMIGDSAFFGMSAEQVTIPAAVREIGKDAFRSLVLKEINVDSDNGDYSSEDGILLDKGKNTILMFPGGRTEIYTSPDCVTEIAAYAFRNSLCESVSFPNVKVVGEGAFFGSEIITAKLPVVELLGESAFQGSDVNSVEIPLLKELKDYTFLYCYDLKSIDMRNVVRIGWKACDDLDALEELVLGENFVSGDFKKIPNLKKVYSYNPVASPDVNFKSGNNHSGYTNIKEATLYVPKGSFNSYYLSDNWGDFGEIIEMEDGSVEEIGDDGIAVRTEDGRIVVEGCGDGVRAEVYDLSGRLAYAGEAAAIPELSAGIYVVRIAGVAYKVAVR